MLLEIAKEYLLLNAAIKEDENVQFNKIRKAQKNAIVNKLDKAGKLPDVHTTLEKMLMVLKVKPKKKHLPKIDASLQSYFLHPDENLSTTEKVMVWKMLCQLYPHNPVLTYLFNKTTFYAQYANWKAEQQVWVIDQVLKHKGLFGELVGLNL